MSSAPEALSGGHQEIHPTFDDAAISSHNMSNVTPAAAANVIIGPVPGSKRCFEYVDSPLSRDDQIMSPRDVGRKEKESASLSDDRRLKVQAESTVHVDENREAKVGGSFPASAASSPAWDSFVSPGLFETDIGIGKLPRNFELSHDNMEKAAADAAQSFGISDQSPLNYFNNAFLSPGIDGEVFYNADEKTDSQIEAQFDEIIEASNNSFIFDPLSFQESNFVNSTVDDDYFFNTGDDCAAFLDFNELGDHQSISLAEEEVPSEVEHP
jgi:hypothetical protein